MKLSCFWVLLLRGDRAVEFFSSRATEIRLGGKPAKGRNQVSGERVYTPTGWRPWVGFHGAFKCSDGAHYRASSTFWRRNPLEWDDSSCYVWLSG